MYQKTLLTLVFVLETSTGWAIAYGEPDLNNLYPNVASVRGVITATNVASLSCSGSLIAKDEQKFVILTAAHCAIAWKARLGSDAIQTVGVSFEQNNVVNGNIRDATYYFRGGVPISNPLYLKSSNQGMTDFDTALVVFPINALDFNGVNFSQKYAQLAPVNLPPYTGYIQGVANSFKNPGADLIAITVGYGSGEILAKPGENKGDSIRNPTNNDTFPIRYIADHASFMNFKQQGRVITFSNNPATGDNGGCFGDSGGPLFYQDPSLGLTQITINSYGDMNCRSYSSDPVLDHPTNARFISCAFVPGDATAVQACVDALPTN